MGHFSQFSAIFGHFGQNSKIKNFKNGYFGVFLAIFAVWGYFWPFSQNRNFCESKFWPFLAIFAVSRLFWHILAEIQKSKISKMAIFTLFLANFFFSFQKWQFWPFLSSLKMAKSKIRPFWHYFKRGKVNFGLIFQHFIWKKGQFFQS